MPAAWLSQYSLRNAGSVASCCVTSYWSELNRDFKRAIDLYTRYEKEEPNPQSKDNALWSVANMYKSAGDVDALVRKGLIKGLAHITGGGLIENPPRMLPKSLQCKFDWDSWTRPPLFQWLAEAGPVEEEEMRRTFNCGLGLVLCVAREDADSVLSGLRASGESAWVVGELAAA